MWDEQQHPTMQRPSKILPHRKTLGSSFSCLPLSLIPTASELVAVWVAKVATLHPNLTLIQIAEITVSFVESPLVDH
jgi:hypothetical protein